MGVRYPKSFSLRRNKILFILSELLTLSEKELRFAEQQYDFLAKYDISPIQSSFYETEIKKLSERIEEGVFNVSYRFQYLELSGLKFIFVSDKQQCDSCESH